MSIMSIMSICHFLVNIASLKLPNLNPGLISVVVSKITIHLFSPRCDVNFTPELWARRLMPLFEEKFIWQLVQRKCLLLVRDWLQSMIWISENSPHNTFAGYFIFMQHPCVGPVTKTVSDFCQVKEIFSNSRWWNNIRGS